MFNPTIKRETFRRALLTSVLLLTGAGMSFADVNAGSQPSTAGTTPAPTRNSSHRLMPAIPSPSL